MLYESLLSLPLILPFGLRMLLTVNNIKISVLLLYIYKHRSSWVLEVSTRDILHDTKFNDLTFIYNANDVGVLDSRETVGDRDACASFGRLLKCFCDSLRGTKNLLLIIF